MRPGDLSVPAGTLQHHLKNLSLRWDDVKQQWNDPVSRRFEEQYIAPLAPQVHTTAKAIDRLNQVLQKAYLECS